MPGALPASTCPFARSADFPEKDGAAYRTRTCDPRITNAMLYQLS